MGGTVCASAALVPKANAAIAAIANRLEILAFILNISASNRLIAPMQKR